MQVRRFATLTAAALLLAVVSATAQTINISTLDDGGPHGGTGFGHSQTVVSNQYGYFATYNQEQVGGTTDLSAANWWLVRSTDGGATFTKVDEGIDGTSAPVIETDRDGNIYLIHSDWRAVPDTNPVEYASNAYFRRYLAANNFAPPATELTLPYGGAQKFSAVIDESRGRMYYAAAQNVPDEGIGFDTVWFFTIPLNGSSYSRVRLTKPSAQNPNVDAHYPHLYLDEHDHLYAAWTTVAMLPAPHYWNYYSIHFMRSRDGGVNWERLDGDPLDVPVIADQYGPTHEVNLPADRNASPWLWSMIVKQGKAHFWYRAGGHTGTPMRYVRFDTVRGDTDVTPLIWGGPTYSLSALQGDCSTRRERLDSTIYCISTSPEDDNNPNTPQNDRLSVVYTTDNGQTWQDYAVTAPYASCSKCYYGINTARRLAGGTHLIGSFTKEPRDPVTGVAPMKFFSVPVLPPANPARLPASVTTSVSVADPMYSADKAGDNNPTTQWVASLDAYTVVANNNAWIQLDFGGVQEVDQLYWTGAQMAPYPAHSPTHYTITASKDGVNWTTVASRTHASAVINGSEPIYVNARYLRLTTTKVNDGSGWSLSFFEFWAEGPMRSRLTATGANASAWEPSYPPGAAIDGALNTLFVASTTAQASNNNAWFYIDLGSAQPIARLKWRPGVNGPYPAHLPADYSIQVSNDLGTWLTLKSRTNPIGVLNGDELIAATARYIRVLTTKVNDGTGWSLGFGEFWVEY